MEPDRVPAPPALHTVLSWLDRNVRRPCEGSFIDRTVFSPVKEAYVVARKQS